MAERIDLLPRESAGRWRVRARRARRRDRAPARDGDRGGQRRATLRHFDPQIARDRVLRVDLQRGVERRCGLVELPHLEAAAREACPRPLVRGREPGELFVGTTRIEAEFAAPGEVHGLLFERDDRVHTRIIYGRAPRCASIRRRCST